MPRASPPEFVSRRNRPEHQQRRAGTGREITIREFGLLGRHTGAKLQQAAKDFQGFDDLDQAWKSDNDDDQENAGALVNRSSLFPESPQSVSTAPNDPEPEIAAKRLEFNAEDNDDNHSADVAVDDDVESISEAESEPEQEPVQTKKASRSARTDKSVDEEPEPVKRADKKSKSKPKPAAKAAKKSTSNDVRKKTNKLAERPRDLSPVDNDENSEPDDENIDGHETIPDSPSPIARASKKGAIKDAKKKTRKPAERARSNSNSPVDETENSEPENEEDVDESEVVPDSPSPVAKASKKGAIKDAKKKTRKPAERAQSNSNSPVDETENSEPENEEVVDDREVVPDSPSPAAKQKKKPAGKALSSPVDNDENREPNEVNIDEPDDSSKQPLSIKSSQSKSKKSSTKTAPAKKKRRQTLLIIDEAEQSGLIEPETVVIENDKRVRRSHRARCRPVNFFECEQPNYIRGPGGLFTLDREKTTIKHVPTPPRPQARRVRTKRRRPKSWDPSSDEEEDELVPLSGETKVIGPSGKERRQIVAVRPSDHFMVRIPTKPPAGVQAQNKYRTPTICKFDGLSGILSGLIRIPAAGTKYPETASRTEALFVAACERNSLRVKINGHEFILSKGDSFMIPVNNVYSIQNTSGRKQAELFFSALPAPTE